MLSLVILLNLTSIPSYISPDSEHDNPKAPVDNDVTFINIKSINLLAKKAGLYPPNISITINEGSLFYLKGKYNLIVIVISIILSLISIGGVGMYSHFEIKKRMQQYEPDSII